MKTPSNLLSKKSLHELLKACGIKRVASDAYLECERITRHGIKTLAKQLEEQLLIEGRTTLRARDIKLLHKKAAKEKTDAWEI